MVTGGVVWCGDGVNRWETGSRMSSAARVLAVVVY
jgi:hypothetical protein